MIYLATEYTLTTHTIPTQSLKNQSKTKKALFKFQTKETQSDFFKFNKIQLDTAKKQKIKIIS